MTKQFFIYSFLITIISLGCSPQKNKTNPLIGKWIAKDDYSIEFDSYGNAKVIMRGEEWPGYSSVSQKEADGKYHETVYGPLKYEYSIMGDSIFFNLIGSLNKKTLMKYGAVIDNNRLIKWNYKTLPGIKRHIDEVGTYWKNGIQDIKEEQKIIVIIDEDHEGPLHIAFNQPTGEPILKNEDGLPVITMQSGSVTKTQLPHDPLFMSIESFDFKVRDCETGVIRDIHDWSHYQYRKLVSSMHASDTVNFENKDFQFSAFSLGYNQWARDMLDYQFGEYIEGQVASFTIGYLEDQYSYKDYFRKLKKGSSDIKN